MTILKLDNDKIESVFDCHEMNIPYIIEREGNRIFIEGEMSIDELIKLADLFKQSEWISVGDKLPEIGVGVLIYFRDSEKQLVTYRMQHGNFRPQWQYDSMHNGVATHWMPLPKAPNT